MNSPRFLSSNEKSWLTVIRLFLRKYDHKQRRLHLNYAQAVDLATELNDTAIRIGQNVPNVIMSKAVGTHLLILGDWDKILFDDLDLSFTFFRRTDTITATTVNDVGKHADAPQPTSLGKHS